MEDLYNVSPASLLEMLQGTDVALDRRLRERLADGIEALIAENRDLAVRAKRAEIERDALLAAIGRWGFVYDTDGRVIAGNPDDPVARALPGLEGTIRSPDGRPVPHGNLPVYRALRGEVLESSRYTLRESTGEDRHIRVSGSPVITDGGVSGAVVVWQDVTAEEQARRQMEETNVLLEGLFESLGDIVGIQLPDHTILRYNRAGYEMLGMTPEEVAGRKCYELIGRTGPCAVCATAHAVASKKREVVEKFVPELGRYLECRSSPILGPNGEVAFVVEQLYDITDRRRAEDARRESEATARALLNAPPDMIALVDMDGRFIDANDMLLRRVSRSREDLIGMNVLEVFPEDAVRIYRSRLQAVSGSGKSMRFEEMWQGRWYSTVLYPVRDASGAVTRVAVVARDITERKQGEDALRKRTHDLNERVKELSTLYAVSRIVEQPGTSLDEILSEVARALPSGWQFPEDLVARITLRGRKFETEGFRETPWRQTSPIVAYAETVGTVEVCYLHEKPEMDDGPFLADERSLIDTIAGRLGRAIERVQAAEDLQKSESQFQEIMQQSFDLIYTCYHEGGISYISPAVMRILGYTPDELIGCKCRDYVVPSSLPEWEKGRTKIAAGEPVEGLGIEFRRKDGSAAFLELNESPIVRDRSVVGVHVVGRDITERKQNEHLRQQAFEQIERNIEQFAILGDHIRQPLQVILGMTEVLEEGVAVERIREQVERINNYVRELDRGWIESRQVREFLRKHELA
ncbi:PAS domain S-box protein [Methanoculleus sp. UBA430]|uniref:PAS domain S-box protein n=1 Tax=Methanoculleus sp. UBA430 TaxID=1915511 RepID=UPI0025DD5463|nr:PAS domain S-box protein [Methanoculleus sp. UBA430]